MRTETDAHHADSFSVPKESRSPGPLVWSECSWRNHPAQTGRRNTSGQSAFLSRYNVTIENEPFELRNDEPDPTYMLTMNVRSSDFDIACGAFTLKATRLALYDMWTTGPRVEPLRGVIKRSAEVFRVVLPEPLVQECYEAVHGRRPDGLSSLIPTEFVRDRFVRRLFTSLWEVSTSPASYAEPLIDAMGVVLGRRLVAIAAAQSGRPMREVRALGQAMLRRVIEYIEENLENPVYLQELSELAGLSRTHFAAQFKAATQCSPHAYILDRRIARAKSLLLVKDRELVEVALESGFSSQAHFTKVFRRLTGKPPGQWRKG